MSNFIVQKSPKSYVSEAYRTLRTNIQFLSFDRKIQTILITSPGPSEGKSTISGNLALTLAEAGKKVLLIDCDLRKPSIHKKFNISNLAGLTNVLAQGLKIENACMVVRENLYVLPSGTIPPNPVDILASKKMREFIKDMKNYFQYVIMDAPPVLPVADAQVLSTIADGVLLVISSGQAERHAVFRAKDLLVKVNANIIGAVINKVDMKSRRHYDTYYAYEEKVKGRKKK